MGGLFEIIVGPPLVTGHRHPRSWEICGCRLQIWVRSHIIKDTTRIWLPSVFESWLKLEAFRSKWIPYHSSLTNRRFIQWICLLYSINPFVILWVEWYRRNEVQSKDLNIQDLEVTNKRLVNIKCSFLDALSTLLPSKIAPTRHPHPA